MVELPPVRKGTNGSGNLDEFTLWPFVRLLGGKWKDGWSWKSNLPMLGAKTPLDGHMHVEAPPSKSTLKPISLAAAKTAPKASAKPQAVPWERFKKQLQWVEWKGKRFACVKHYLKAKGLPYSNPERKVKKWQNDVVGKGKPHLFDQIPRHLFDEPQGGWTHAVVEEALECAYERN